MIPSKTEWMDALTARHGLDLHKRFSCATVAVCGLGGLGSNIAIALARAGIGKLLLIDFDRVDITNLHRQQYKITQIGMPKTEATANNLAEIAPYVHTELHDVCVTAENVAQLVKNADVICEAFDRAEAKAMLVNTVLEVFPEKYVVSASGMAGMGSPNTIVTRKITPHFYLCGDGTSNVEEGICLISSRVMLCASHQAHTVVRILAEESAL